MVAREVMVPRTDAFMVDINDDTKEIIESILKQNFSRIPVSVMMTRTMSSASSIPNVSWTKDLSMALIILS